MNLGAECVDLVGSEGDRCWRSLGIRLRRDWSGGQGVAICCGQTVGDGCNRSLAVESCMLIVGSLFLSYINEVGSVTILMTLSKLDVESIICRRRGAITLTSQWDLEYQ